MSFFNLSLALSCFLGIGLALVQSSNAQNSPQDYLNAHNSARRDVGVSDIVWDINLANYALNYSNSRRYDCAMVHSKGPYGENLAAGSSSTFSGVSAVNLWIAEKSDYFYSSNTCRTGKVCGHYTQVVWRNSLRLGCARVQCNNGWWFVSCNYSPPGNYVGQKPY